MIYVRIALAVVGAVLLTALIGFLSLRAEAVELGVALTWDNQPDAVGTAQSPWLQRVAIAAIVGLALYALWSVHSVGKHAWLPAVAAAFTLAVLAGWFLATTAYPYAGAVQSAFADTDTSSGGSASITETPIVAWLRTGALSPAIHVSAAACAVIAWKLRQPVARRKVSDFS